VFNGRRAWEGIVYRWLFDGNGIFPVNLGTLLRKPEFPKLPPAWEKWEKCRVPKFDLDDIELDRECWWPEPGKNRAPDRDSWAVPRPAKLAPIIAATK
jgi:hypothetical protein